MYAKMTFRSMIRNIKVYLTYFLTVISAIAIFFTMKVIEFNEVSKELSSMYRDVQNGMKVADFVVVIAVAVLIVYTNMFLISKRKKEIGLYSLLGMKNSRISYVLFLEIVLMGVFGLVIGMVMGSVLSYGMMLLLFRLLLIDGNALQFSLPLPAVLETMKFFTILILISAVSNSVVIYRYKLIDLFKGERKAQKFIKRSGALNLTLGVASILIIALGYYLASILGISNVILGVEINPMMIFGASFTCVVLGTFGFYMFASSFLFDFMSKFKQRYYKGLNMYISRQMTHKIMMNAKMLAIITLLISTTIGAFGTTLSFYYSRVIGATHYTSFSYNIELNEKDESDVINKGLNEDAERIFAKHSGKNLRTFDETVRVLDLNPEGGKMKYAITVDDFRLLYENAIEKELYSGDVQWNISNEEALYCDRGFSASMEDIEDRTFGQKEFVLRPVGIGPIANNFPFCSPLYIVTSETFEVLAGENGFVNVYRFVNIENNLDAEALTNDLYLNDVLNDYTKAYSYYGSYRDALGGKAAMLFIGLFIGVIFLIASGSTISIRQLTEALNDKQRMDSLRRIGVDEKLIKRTVYKQLSIVFFTPVALTACHMVFALGFVGRTLQENITVPCLMAFGGFLSVYVIYYVLTVRSYYKLTM